MSDFLPPQITPLDQRTLPEQFELAGKYSGLVESQVARRMIIDPFSTRLALASFITGKDAVFTGDPGVGKTAFVEALGATVNGSVAVIEGTEETTASDIIGATMFHQGRGEYEFMPGPALTANLLLANEVNRMPERSQSALLAPMSEGRVVTPRHGIITVQDPFSVFMAYNPYFGDLDLAVVDRAAVGVHMDRLSADQAVEASRKQEAKVGIVMDLSSACQLGKLASRIEVPDEVRRFTYDVVSGLLHNSDVARTSTGQRPINDMVAISRAVSALEGRSSVNINDARRLISPIMRHRTTLTHRAQKQGSRVEDVINHVARSL